jgi:extracellular elastinolytic metalloproteinase
VDATNIGAIKLQQKADSKNKLYIFEPVSGLTNIEVHAQLALVMDKYKKVHLAWVVQFHSLDNYHFWNIEVDAASGALISKSDQIIHCSFGTGKYLEAQESHGHVHNSATSWIETPEAPSGADNDVEGPQAGAYRVYRYNVEAPIFGSRTLISNPDDAVASPYGWHDDNGVAGAEYTITRGNNVYAYADKDW